jgi:hypothetical protein
VCVGATRGAGLGPGACHPYLATVLAVRASNQQSLSCLGVRVHQGMAAGRCGRA